MLAKKERQTKGLICDKAMHLVPYGKKWGADPGSSRVQRLEGWYQK